VGSINTVISPGSTSTVTQPDAVPMGGTDLANFYRELLRRKTMALQHPVDSFSADARPVASMAAAPSRDEMASGPSPIDKQLAYAQKEDQLLQMQARQNPAPMRMVTGAGIIPGYVPDTNAMNAYQRQAYLPQGSTQVYGPEHEGAARKKLSEDLAWNAQQDAMRKVSSY
jgi:hypothetical protein